MNTTSNIIFILDDTAKYEIFMNEKEEKKKFIFVFERNLT